MSAHAYTEDQLVEQPAKRLFCELGWSLAQPHPHPGPPLFCGPSPQPLPEGEELGEGVWVDEIGLFGRETKGEVVLVSRLRAALEWFNPALPPEAITAAVDSKTSAGRATCCCRVSCQGRWNLRPGMLFH